MNDREIQGWKEIARRTPRRTKSAVVIAAIATFAAVVAFVAVNAFSALTAPTAAVAVAKATPTAIPTTAPAAPTTAPTAPNTNPGRGFGGKGDHHDRGFGYDGWMGGMPFMFINDDVAKALNLTTDQLRTQVMSGKSLSDIATAQKVDIQVVKDVLFTSLKTQLDAQVTAGKITQARADALLSQLKTNIDQIVNGKRGRRPGQPGDKPGQPPRKGDNTTTDSTYSGL